jgi:5-methylcytosine-specific restriction endonuclease McrA
MVTNSKDSNSPKKNYMMKWCRRCRKVEYEKPYQKHRKDCCEFCGFVPVNMCQLDVDHIDGNPKNHNKENLQTLCANCHRLKTFVQRWGLE